MKRIKLILGALAVALVAMFALAPVAQAQEAHVVAADPPFVAAAGSHDVTISGAGWPADATVVILPCSYNSYEAAATAGADECDTSPASLTFGGADGDGNISITGTFDIPADGMCIGVGTLDSAHVGVYCMGVGAPILPNTGSESTMIAIIGAAVLAGGAMIVLSTRRRSYVS